MERIGGIGHGDDSSLMTTTAARDPGVERSRAIGMGFGTGQASGPGPSSESTATTDLKRGAPAVTARNRVRWERSRRGRAPLRCTRMRRLLKWLAILVAGIGIAIAALVAYVYVASGRVMARTYAVEAPRVPIPSDPASIARGKYLAEKVAVCTECHGTDLGGKVVEDDVAMGRLVASNLTRGRGGLPADYSDQDFVRALTHGVKRDGRSVIFMPTADYLFTADDLGAIVAYVKSMPSVDRTLPAMSVGPVTRALGLFGEFSARVGVDDRSQPAAARGASRPVGRGRDRKYLASSAGCHGCHGAQLTGGGGPPPGGSNITPVGIGGWSERDFMAALRTHRRPNGSVIDEAMPRAYGDMSDEDRQNLRLRADRAGRRHEDGEPAEGDAVTVSAMVCALGWRCARHSPHGRRRPVRTASPTRAPSPPPSVRCRHGCGTPIRRRR